ncbi:hypothetical protein SAMN05444156_0990 [Verrucomicrobium sp. GAS474]|uniref:hypothetical protein n=1 Tax=Verrucomicrobium sp. GAS474 TaxID=1882831 RepID=UPI00087D74D1|nr:hypothetical protein [Verrucomicrobium sp. GAS474]SDT94874.1 hypothetical protein SAMN05444156_0990 [Verrucomicrobium sp. GAS474]
MTGLSRSSEINRAVNGLPLLLDESRSYAMSHNTYVWVGFSEDLAAHRLTVALMAGTTGQSDDLDTGNLVPIAQLHAYDHFALRTTGGLAAQLSGMAANGDDLAGSAFPSFQRKAGAETVTFAKVLRFGPQGEAAIKPTGGASHWIEIGLQPTRDGSTNERDIAVLQVATLTGQVQIFRR